MAYSFIPVMEEQSKQKKIWNDKRKYVGDLSNIVLMNYLSGSSLLIHIEVIRHSY